MSEKRKPGAKRVDLSDSTGLTAAQKKIIQHTWRTNFKSDLKYHGCEIYMRFLTKYPQFINLFDFPSEAFAQIELMQNKTYQAHCLMEMMAIDNLIEYGLDDPPLYGALLKIIASRHLKQKITSQPIENFFLIMLNYLIETFKRPPKVEVKEAWRTFLESIFNGFLRALKL